MMYDDVVDYLEDGDFFYHRDGDDLVVRFSQHVDMRLVFDAADTLSRVEMSGQYRYFDAQLNEKLDDLQWIIKTANALIERPAHYCVLCASIFPAGLSPFSKEPTELEEDHGTLQEVLSQLGLKITADDLNQFFHNRHHNQFFVHRIIKELPFQQKEVVNKNVKLSNSKYCQQFIQIDCGCKTMCDFDLCDRFVLTQSGYQFYHQKCYEMLVDE